MILLAASVATLMTTLLLIGQIASRLKVARGAEQMDEDNLQSKPCECCGRMTDAQYPESFTVTATEWLCWDCAAEGCGTQAVPVQVIMT